MKNRFLVGGILVVCLMIAGCGSLELYTGEDGRPHTKLTDALGTSSEIVNTASGYVPGYGVIGGGVALLLSGMANGILSVVVKRHRRKTIR